MKSRTFSSGFTLVEALCMLFALVLLAWLCVGVVRHEIEKKQGASEEPLVPAAASTTTEPAPEPKAPAAIDTPPKSTPARSAPTVPAAKDKAPSPTPETPAKPAEAPATPAPAKA